MPIIYLLNGQAPQYEIIRHVKSSRCDFAENVTIIEIALSKTSLSELQRAVQRDNPNNRIALTQTRSTLAPVSNAVRFYISMRRKAALLNTTIFKEYYVTQSKYQPRGSRLDR
ncbi:unnamed protein product [Hymenolepis diminuta]|uniref:Uncharacterized protein n=1 Tax=Hymenolepis diminuta TaxID=6216 RepID=A0A564YY78_HYMDI|nr:unnamed protein product [Hymenolepis diminuta]